MASDQTAVFDAAGPRFASGLSGLADRYRLLLCDIWGVVHGGVRAFPRATEALRNYRGGGGHVILVSNAPRPWHAVAKQLDGFGLPRDAYDSILTSGDLTRDTIAARPGVPLHHLGPARDLPLFEGLDAPLVPLADAAYVVCTGLFDDTTETPDDYAEMFTTMLARGLVMVCANPDLIVHRGGEPVYCAGALAVAYQARGGAVSIAGKPYGEIYDAAFARVAPLALTRRDALAVGDSIRTDVTGARNAGIDSLFIAAGIHIDEIMPAGTLDRHMAADWISRQTAVPTFIADHLAW